MMQRTSSAAKSNAALVDQYLTYMDRVAKRSPNTVYKYRQSYAEFLVWAGDKTLAAVTIADLHAYLDRPRKRKAVVAPATIKREMMELRSLFKWLHQDAEVIPKNPTLKLRAPKVDNEDPKPVDIDVWRTLWFSNLRPDERVAFGFAYFCGLRRHEVTLLSADQVDGDRLVSVKRKGGKKLGYPWRSCLDLYESKLPDLLGEPRLFTDALAKLRKQRADAPALLPWADERKPQYVTRCVTPMPEGLVNPALFNSRLKSALVRAGLDEGTCTPHALRHSFGTNLIRAKVPVQTVSRLMGHSDLRVTMRYVDLGADPLRDFLDQDDDAEMLPRRSRW